MDFVMQKNPFSATLSVAPIPYSTDELVCAPVSFFFTKVWAQGAPWVEEQ